jgi:nucleotidyltransferase substrate binding protein (TIGR01987 family)
MPLDLTPLARAIESLRAGLARHLATPGDDQLRDGLIQRFEFTYELAHRTLRRHLRETSASPDLIDQLSFADLIRTGNEQALLHADWPTWRTFRDMRARTSHTYDAAIARAVVAGIPDFLAEATHLHAALAARPL